MIYVYNNQFGGFHALLVYVCNVIASYGYFLEEKNSFCRSWNIDATELVQIHWSPIYNHTRLLYK